MTDLDKLTKSELKKLIEKKKKKHKKKHKKKKPNKESTKIVYKDNPTRQTTSGEMARQKPIIPMTNTPYNPSLQNIRPSVQSQGFGMGASIDQRNNDITRGQVNETSNQLATVKQDIVDINLRTEKQLAGDKKRSETAKSKNMVRTAEEKKATEANRREIARVKKEKKALETSLKNPSTSDNMTSRNQRSEQQQTKTINTESKSFNRDAKKEENYFNPKGDNVDNVGNEVVLKGDDGEPEPEHKEEPKDEGKDEDGNLKEGDEDDDEDEEDEDEDEEETEKEKKEREAKEKKEARQEAVNQRHNVTVLRMTEPQLRDKMKSEKSRTGDKKYALGKKKINDMRDALLR